MMPMDYVAYDPADPADPTGNKALGYSGQSGFKTLFTSSDSGKSWQQKGVLPQDITNLQDPKERISKIIISPLDSNTIVMSGASGFVWKSMNNGNSWETILSLETLP